MYLDELICHMKIEKANRFKDKDSIIANELSFKANLVESSSGPKLNKFKNVENTKKKAKP